MLEPKLSDQAVKYIKSLDRTMRRRISDKILELAKDPTNIRLSKPLKNSEKRGARVGSYRILFQIIDGVLLVSDVGPRGQIYREA